ncbi:hypothetical protein [Campylobacter vicugnae]|uniref:hypothetical protein n=1 Tax=Campylobacter vicugnae TaxID=1660076 RepID=UPI000A338C9A|nr:hypothetical protein [Campylobacter sp. S0112]
MIRQHIMKINEEYDKLSKENLDLKQEINKLNSDFETIKDKYGHIVQKFSNILKIIDNQKLDLKFKEEFIHILMDINNLNHIFLNIVQLQSSQEEIVKQTKRKQK